MKRSRASVVALSVLALCSFGVPLASARAQTAGLDVQVQVRDGVEPAVALSGVDENTPLELRPERELVVDLKVTNTGSTATAVRTVRLDGHVLGMTFFDYASRVDLKVEPGQTEQLSLPLDLSELGSQATGLLPARFVLLGADRAVLAEESFPVRVRGSLWSTYGTFGLLVGAVALVLLAAALVRLALGRLPAHRWLRAVRFAVPGVGLGLTLTFTLSALALLVPSAEKWVSIVVLAGLLGLLLGFLTPNPVPRRALPRVPGAHVDPPPAQAHAVEPVDDAPPVLTGLRVEPQGRSTTDVLDLRDAPGEAPVPSTDVPDQPLPGRRP